MHLHNHTSHTRGSFMHLLLLPWKRLVLLVLLVLPQGIHAQQSLNELIRPGSRITYRLHVQERFYDLLVTVKTITPSLEFDWEIKDSAGAAGSITITRKGLLRSNIFNHRFTTGAILLSDRETSLVLSKKLFNRLTRRFKKPTSIYLAGTSGEEYQMGLFDEPKPVLIRINGVDTTVKGEVVRSLGRLARQYVATGEELFYFYRSPAFPLILRLTIMPAFEMDIVEIASP